MIQSQCQAEVIRPEGLMEINRKNMTPTVGLQMTYFRNILYHLKVICLHSPTKARNVPSKNPTYEFPAIPKDTTSHAEPDPGDWKLEGPALHNCVTDCDCESIILPVNSLVHIFQS